MVLSQRETGRDRNRQLGKHNLTLCSVLKPPHSDQHTRHDNTLLKSVRLLGVTLWSLDNDELWERAGNGLVQGIMGGEWSVSCSVWAESSRCIRPRRGSRRPERCRRAARWPELDSTRPSGKQWDLRCVISSCGHMGKRESFHPKLYPNCCNRWSGHVMSSPDAVRHATVSVLLTSSC